MGNTDRVAASHLIHQTPERTAGLCCRGATCDVAQLCCNPLQSLTASLIPPSGSSWGAGMCAVQLHPCASPEQKDGAKLFLLALNPCRRHDGAVEGPHSPPGAYPTWPGHRVGRVRPDHWLL